MWKETYLLGVENIDAQHKKLFEKTGELMQEIEGQCRVEIYREIIEFLEEYVVIHFRDEEEYFESLGYINEEEHKKQHKELAECVKKYSIELKETNYDIHIVKKLVGMLSAWLIYHVVKEDLKYTEKTKEEHNESKSSYMEHFANSTIQVLETMAGINTEEVDKKKIYDNLNEYDVFIEIGLIGEIKGRVIFGFTKEFSSQLVETMMSFAPEEIDELVCSVLAEVSNIASGNGTIAISSEGISCDIRPPKILQKGEEVFPPHEEMRINTKMGNITVAVYLE